MDQQDLICDDDRHIDNDRLSEFFTGKPLKGQVEIDYSQFEPVVLADGTIVRSGDVKEGVVNGLAQIIYQDETMIYTGSVVQNKRQGQGTQTYSDGGVYKGYFFDDLRHGPGTMKFADGSQYDGRFEDGVISGYGKLVYADGSIFDGFWLNNKKHGEGVFTNKEGVKELGLWKEDEKIFNEAKKEYEDD